MHSGLTTVLTTISRHLIFHILEPVSLSINTDRQNKKERERYKKASAAFISSVTVAWSRADNGLRKKNSEVHESQKSE